MNEQVAEVPEGPNQNSHPERAGGVRGTVDTTAGVVIFDVPDGDGGDGGSNGCWSDDGGSDDGGSADGGSAVGGGEGGGSVTQSQYEYACSPSPYPTHAISSLDGQAIVLQSELAVQLPDESGPGGVV